MVSVKALHAFNKFGNRLLFKETNVVLQDKVRKLADGTIIKMGKNCFHSVKPPEGAESASFAEVERAFGKENFQIITFFDKDGKIFLRQRYFKDSTMNNSVLESSSEYLHMIRESLNNTPTKEHFRTFTRTFNGKDIVKDKYTMLTTDIDRYGKKSAIKTSCEHIPNRYIFFDSLNRNTTSPAFPCRADTFDIEIKELGNRLSPKSYNSRRIYCPLSGNWTVMRGEGSNITQEELKLLNADRYMPLRFHKELNSYEYIKKDAFARQNIPLDTRVEYEKIAPSLEQEASTNGSRINVQYCGAIPNPHKLMDGIKNINHEARHIWQYRLVDSLNKGQINNPKTKELALKFKESLARPYNAHTEYEKYMASAHERDAYKVGDAVGDEFYSQSQQLSNIFPQFNWHFNQ